MAFVAAGTATDFLDLLDQLVIFANANGWTTLAQTKEAVSAVVAAGGTGYTVGDQLSLVGGNGVDIVAVFNVDSEAAGVVTAVSVVTAGNYDYEPANPAATTGGTGSGCTLTVTYQPSTIESKKVTLRGVGSGSDQIFVSIAAIDFGGGAFHWDLRGHVGFQDQVDYLAQPNTSPNGSQVPLNNATITYWFFVTGRRIIGVFRMGSTYTNMYMGFMNPYGTAVSYPYPLIIVGCTSSSTVIFSNSTAGMGGLVDPINASSSPSSLGPAFVHDPGGTWKSVRNSGGTSSNRPSNGELVIWPAGNLFPSGTSFTWGKDFIPPVSSPTFELKQTPDSTAPSVFRFPLIPTIVMERTPVEQILGELDNVRWSGTNSETAGLAVSEDVFNINGDDFFLFQNCNRTDPWTFVLVKKE